MSWTPRQTSAFARQGVRLRTRLAAEDTADNIRFGARTLRAYFDRTSQERTIEEAGFRYLCDAVAHIPLDAGLTEADLPLGATLTYLPFAETYRIEARRAQPLSGYIRLILRRVNGQSLSALSL